MKLEPLFLATLCLAALFLSGCGRPMGAGRQAEPVPGQPAPRETVRQSPAFDGGSVGNGGDDTPIDEGSAWFLGPDPIRYCIELSPTFGASESEIAEDIEDVLRRWQRYAALRGRNGANASATELAGAFLREAKQPEIPAPPRPIVPGIADRRVRIPRCDGSQELTFYLGMETSTVASYRSRYSRPLAFAQRLDYRLRTGRGKGFIWVQSTGAHSPGFPRWDIRPARRAMLLHEIGHVMGCAHVRGTIMDADVVRLLRKLHESETTELEWASFDRIDQRRVLVLPRKHLSLAVGLDEVGHPLAVATLSATATAGHTDVFDPTLGMFAFDKMLFGSTTKLVNPESLRAERLVLEEVSRERGDAATFKTSFLPIGSDSPRISSLATETVTFIGHSRVLDGDVVVIYNGDDALLKIIGQHKGRSRILLAL